MKGEQEMNPRCTLGFFAANLLDDHRSNGGPMPGPNKGG